MTHHYLTKHEYAAESWIAAYIAGLGCWVGVNMVTGRGTPLQWTDWTPQTQLWAAQIMITAGVIHLVGVNINGHWRWSPVVRLVGVLIHLVMITAISTGALPNGTAVYTYPALALFLSVKAVEISIDVWNAVWGSAGAHA